MNQKHNNKKYSKIPEIYPVKPKKPEKREDLGRKQMTGEPDTVK